MVRPGFTPHWHAGGHAAGASARRACCARPVWQAAIGAPVPPDATRRGTPRWPQTSCSAPSPFTATAPTRLWSAAITHVPTQDEAFLYLAVILDGFSRRVVSWAMTAHLRAELMLQGALEMAHWNRRPDGGLIHHSSDHGCQYNPLLFGERCQTVGIRCSIGSVGDCYAHALAESFFAPLECELLARQTSCARPCAPSLRRAQRSSSTSKSCTTASVATQPLATCHPTPLRGGGSLQDWLSPSTVLSTKAGQLQGCQMVSSSRSTLYYRLRALLPYLSVACDEFDITLVSYLCKVIDTSRKPLRASGLLLIKRNEWSYQWHTRWKGTTMSVIREERTIAVAPRSVFNALTKPEEIARWWSDEARVKPEVGSLGEFRFRPPAGVLQFEVAELDQDEKVSWISRQGPPHWSGTSVTWQLELVGPGTKVVFTHEGFARVDAAYEQTRGNWRYFLDSLKSYLETGKGTPGSPPFV